MGLSLESQSMHTSLFSFYNRKIGSFVNRISGVLPPVEFPFRKRIITENNIFIDRDTIDEKAISLIRFAFFSLLFLMIRFHFDRIIPVCSEHFKHHVYEHLIAMQWKMIV